MKKLIIMRHCKSDWSSGARSDHDRPLNSRGQRSANALGDWLREQGHMPDTVLCSSAERTVETARRLELPQGVQISVTRDLYLAEPDAMLAALRGVTGDCTLIVGHNPGSAAIAADLSATWPEHLQFPRFPTGATLVLQFDVDSWADIEMQSGTVIDFTVPRDIA